MSEGLAGKGLIPDLGSTGQLTACLSCHCELLESLRNSVSLGPSQGKAALGPCLGVNGSGPWSPAPVPGEEPTLTPAPFLPSRQMVNSLLLVDPLLLTGSCSSSCPPCLCRQQDGQPCLPRLPSIWPDHIMEAWHPALPPQMVDGKGKWEARGPPPGLPPALGKEPLTPPFAFHF